MTGKMRRAICGTAMLQGKVLSLFRALRIIVMNAISYILQMSQPFFREIALLFPPLFRDGFSLSRAEVFEAYMCILMNGHLFSREKDAFVHRLKAA